MTLARDKSSSLRPRSILVAAATALSLTPGFAGNAFAGGLEGPHASAEPLALIVAPADEVLRLNVQIECEGDEGEAIGSRVQTDLQGMFGEQSVLKGDGSSPVLKVVIAPFSDPENPGYDATVSIVAEGETVAGSQMISACELCTHGELAAKVAKEAETLIGMVRSGAVVIGPEEVAGDGDGDAGDGDGDGDVGPAGPEVDGGEDPSGKERVKMGGLGYAGIGAMVLGAAGAGAGAFFLTKENDPPEEPYTQVKSYKGAGTAVLITGVTVLATGVVMFLVDRKRAKAAAKGE